MATLSLSDQILLEISKSSQPMTAQRLAGAISHDLSKTRALIQFMIRNDKLFAAGAVDGGSQTYGLTAHGRSLVNKIESAGSTLDTASPRPLGHHDPRPLFVKHEYASTNSDEDRCTSAPGGPQTMPEQTAQQKPAQADGQIARSVPTIAEYFNRPRCLQHRFGILNSGELAIIGPNNDLVAMLCSDELDALRSLLDDRS